MERLSLRLLAWLGLVGFVMGCGGAAAAPPATAADPAPGAEGSATPEAAPAQGMAAEGDGATHLGPDTGSAGGGARSSDRPTRISPTVTEAAVRFTVVDKEKGPVGGVVIHLTAPGGKKYYAEETDAEGRTELLLPVGVTYDAVYLSLGRREIAATVEVPNEPKLNLNLTIRYTGWAPKPGSGGGAPRFVLAGVEFETGKATLRPESHARLEPVVEYLAHKKSARIEISGHTDNVGNPKANQALSEKRAQSVRAYLVSKGIDGGRIEAVGHGDTKPVASNETEEGRQKNRRIEATEI